MELLSKEEYITVQYDTEEEMILESVKKTMLNYEVVSESDLKVIYKKSLI